MTEAANGRYRRWPWIAVATAAWSAAYGLLGLLWALGVPGFPFGSADRSAVLTLFPDAEARPGGLVIAILGASGASFAVLVAVAGRDGRLRWAVWAAAIIAFALIVVVPDYRVLLTVAYLPLITLGAPFGWPPDVDLSLVLPWPVLNQFVLIVGGALWAGLAVHASGRMASGWGWLRRIGPAATTVAVGVPLVYAATRYAWAAGVPVGLSPDLYRRGQEIGLWAVGAGLATVAVIGALLTLGLVQDWGVRFPRWLPLVGGHPVPTNLAVIPALAAAFVITSAGTMFVRLVATGRLAEAFVFADDVGVAALAPELLWPLWGVALALAAVSYRERRLSPPDPASAARPN
jgi:hypothetical protein